MALFLILAACLLAVNLIAFALCGIDKRRAVKGQWRISEAALLTAGLLGGCFGLFLGMNLFRHKTKHLKFKLLVPLECLLWVALLLFGWVKYGSLLLAL
ncbi:MAG: DUF1294 domain-containing protein [Oscillospiraceae bacterium]